MQPRGVGGAVFAGGPDDEELAGGEGDAGGNGPFGWGAGIVGEVPAGQVDRGGIRIVKLDPVGGLPVLIALAAVVVGDYFRDYRGGGGEGRKRRKRRKGGENLLGVWQPVESRAEHRMRIGAIDWGRQPRDAAGNGTDIVLRNRHTNGQR